jgi:hypothetical protein
MSGYFPELVYGIEKNTGNIHLYDNYRLVDDTKVSTDAYALYNDRQAGFG